LSNRKLPPAPKIDHKPDPRPAKLISKEEAYSERAVYDYERTSMMGAPVAPIEPGDSDPPEPYE
jgi:hypothetical protein